MPLTNILSAIDDLVSPLILLGGNIFMGGFLFSDVSGQCSTGRPKRLTDRPEYLWSEDRL